MTGCGKNISEREVKLIIGEDKFKKLDKRALDGAVGVDPTLHNCPTPDCNYIISWRGMEDGIPECDCPVCGKSSCLVCLVTPYHKDLNCEEFKKERGTAEN
jgi:hypothetical protein